MLHYGNLADDFFVNMNLNTEMPLPSGRETVLDFFERVQKQHPSMRNFYTRDNGDFVLEEDMLKAARKLAELKKMESKLDYSKV